MQKYRMKEGALLLFTEMHQLGLQPSVITYSSLISSCEGLDTDRALQFFGELRRQGHDLCGHLQRSD